MTHIPFEGQHLANPVIIERPDKPSETIHPYIATPDLIKAVNLAILLKRPLLLMGEPGCGKSRLAQAVAYELHHLEDKKGNIVRDYKDFYFEWNIKSSSKAKDGLYEYDAIRRLGDAQILAQKGLSTKDFEKEIEKKKYRKFVNFGEAIRVSKEHQRRAVLLIDEIDKADIDFPNDLLNELDKGVFNIPETDETIEAELKPIIFITSNSEKELPDAFLRRCLFHYIDPLGKDILTDIIRRRFYSKVPKSKVDMELINTAIQQFLDIRKDLRSKQMSVGKNVSTSELIDWYEALMHYKQLKQDAGDLDSPKNALLKQIATDLDKIGKGATDVPFPQILFKNWNTLINFQNKQDGQ